LIIVLLLVLDHLDRHHFASLVILALDDLSECAFADQLKQLESIGNLVTRYYAVVPFRVVEAVVH
jgi:Asp-tRNA(Asn)/Glu-tRNA(Gln) amidotransferase C subunit